MKHRQLQRSRAASAAGFSLIESVVALGLLTVGLLGVAAVFTRAAVQQTSASTDMLAKDKAFEALENIFAARDSKVLRWDQLQNVGDEAGRFLRGRQPLRLAGPDGIIGTIDDTGLQTAPNPGPNGQLGDDDDLISNLSIYEREIIVEPVDDSESLRELRVVIHYKVGGQDKKYELVSYLSSFS